MDHKEYLHELGKVRASRLNDIMYAVSCKVPKDEIGLKSEVEEMFHDDLIEEATAHEEKYGFWPVFEPLEIDYDDPRLDIYNDPIE